MLREGYSRTPIAAKPGVGCRTVYNLEHRTVFKETARQGHPKGSLKFAPFIHLLTMQLMPIVCRPTRLQRADADAAFATVPADVKWENPPLPKNTAKVVVGCRFSIKNVLN